MFTVFVKLITSSHPFNKQKPGHKTPGSQSQTHGTNSILFHSIQTTGITLNLLLPGGAIVIKLLLRTFFQVETVMSKDLIILQQTLTENQSVLMIILNGDKFQFCVKIAQFAGLCITLIELKPLDKFIRVIK